VSGRKSRSSRLELDPSAREPRDEP
jgi:hypothetical protein